jgi:hypothetical protein
MSSSPLSTPKLTCTSPARFMVCSNCGRTIVARVMAEKRSGNRMSRSIAAQSSFRCENFAVSASSQNGKKVAPVRWW